VGFCLFRWHLMVVYILGERGDLLYIVLYRVHCMDGASEFL